MLQSMVLKHLETMHTIQISDKITTKESHGKQDLLPNQRMYGKYKVTVDWIKDIPAVNEINGIEVLVSDTTKKGGHESKGKHGESSHESKGKHGKDKGKKRS